MSTPTAANAAHPDGRYTLTARILHWTVAVLVIGQISVGISLGFMADGPTKNQVYDLHKSTGILILALMLCRLVWRLTHPAPAHGPQIERWQVGVSHAVHWTLYLILLVMPILGWVGSNAFGAAVPVYGLFTMPTIVGEDKPFAEQVLAVHAVLGFVAAALIVLHVSAALYHALIRRDGVLQRMT